MIKANKLTDRDALIFNRKRSSKYDAGYFKIHQIAINEIKDRLIGINREFNTIGIITGHPNDWREAFPDADIMEDNDTIAFKRDNYDLIIHALCLHWSDDPVGQLIQCKNMLVEDGLFLATLLGGKTLHELNYSLSLAESKISNGISPRFMPMGEIRDLGNLLQRVGFGLPVADNLVCPILYDNIHSIMYDLRAMGETNVLLSRKKTFTQSKIIEEAAAIYFKNFQQSNNKLVATFEFIFLTGWFPSDKQQKPLKPGSAKINLGELLDDFAKRTTESDQTLEKK